VQSGTGSDLSQIAQLAQTIHSAKFHTYVYHLPEQVVESNKNR